MPFKSITIRAGKRAKRIIAEKGLSPDLFRIMPAASGGPKWIILYQLDKVLFPWLLNRRADNPLHTVSSSIGAWRMTCLANDDPIAALKRFKHHYFNFPFSEYDGPKDITENSYTVLAHIADGHYADQVLQNPKVFSHYLVNLSRGLFHSESKAVLVPSLLILAAANFVSRKAIGLGFKRALFHDPRQKPPFYNANEMPIVHVPLSKDNLMDAIVATSTIPVVMTGVKDIANGPKGTYRDGGLTDYHFDMDFLGHRYDTPNQPIPEDDDRLVIYPHFMDRIHPGWFDKYRPSRRPHPKHLDDMVFIAPNEDWVKTLPGEKIPDRKDFETLTWEKRLMRWESVITQSKIMAEEFNQWIHSSDPHEKCQDMW